MGEVRVKAKLFNASDEALARRGQMAKNEIQANFLAIVLIY